MICLDIGCGGGDVAFDLARVVGPAGSVIGLDADKVKIDIARAEATAQQLGNVEFRVADLEQCEFPQHLDVGHARFVLSHLHNPGAVLAKLRTALKPGGIIVVADTNFHGLFSHPDSPVVRRYVEMYAATLERRHGDADIGLRLPELLAQAGFADIKIGVVQHAGTSGDAKLISPITLENIADAVVAEGIGSRADVEKLVAELYDFARDSHTVLSGPRIIETWARRPAA
jgi:SAM-dependent methyltransferase